jgi:hypothetical protein
MAWLSELGGGVVRSGVGGGLGAWGKAALAWRRAHRQKEHHGVKLIFW